MMNLELYKKYLRVIKKLTNRKATNYFLYGKGAGIYLCENWLDYINFEKWALTNGWESGKVLIRKDLTRDYSPENCRFVTKEESRIIRSGGRF